MQRYGSSRVTRLRSVLRVAMVTRIGLLLAFSQGPVWAHVDRNMATVPKAAGPPNVLLQSEQAIYSIRPESLARAPKRYGGISHAAAGLAMIIENRPGTSTLSVAGRNVMFVSTGMLDLAGSDTGKAVQLLGKMCGRLQMNLGPTMFPILGNDVMSIGRRARLQGGDLRGAVDDSGTALGLTGKSLLRDAKKFFPDPIIGIRG